MILCFLDCDYCERGWFGTTRQPPRGASVADVRKDYMNFCLADCGDWLDPQRPMCVQCAAEVQKAGRGAGEGAAPLDRHRPQRWLNKENKGRLLCACSRHLGSRRA